jgi:allantoicase
VSDFSPAGLIDLAQPRLGAEVVFATDDFFADKARLIDPAEPVFIPGKYDDNGKWMDGWESRRKRVAGYDWAIVRLGVPGRIEGFELDTRHFTGNYPPRASIDGCYCREAIPPQDAAWTPLLGVVDLQGDSRRLAAAEAGGVWTHVRLNIFPDGGVARLRVFGRVEVDWTAIGDRRVDLLALENGGRGVLANNEHYGRVENLTAPGRGRDMGDGWETRRRREPGHDWAVLELGHAGRIEEVLVDTRHFKGNYPDRCMIQAAATDEGPVEALEARSAAWPVLLPEVKLAADAEHRFDLTTTDFAPVRFVRLNIYPDGGVSRLRLRGRQA